MSPHLVRALPGRTPASGAFVVPAIHFLTSKRKLLLVLLATMALAMPVAGTLASPGIAPGPLTGAATPDSLPRAHRFMGVAALNGLPAPNGALVAATIGGQLCGESMAQEGGAYAIEVASADEIPGCGTPSSTVSFHLDQYPAGSAMWGSAEVTRLDLAAWAEFKTGASAGLNRPQTLTSTDNRGLAPDERAFLTESVVPTPLPLPGPATASIAIPLTRGSLLEGVPPLVLEPDCHGAPITINGTDGDDTITGTEAADVIHGQGGNDIINGGGGNDIICGGGGNDGLNGEDGDDTLDGGVGDDGLGGGDGHDTLSGGDGNDHLSGGSGNDTIDAGAGWDWLYYYSAPGPVTVDLGAGTATGEGNDTLIGVESAAGGNYDDVLISGPSGNTLYGVGGNDTLIGGAGSDQAGYWYAPGSVIADLAAGTATGQGNDTLSSIENLVGSLDYGDVLTGDDGNNSLAGSGGNDSLDGAGGWDNLDGGPNTDTCYDGESVHSCEQPPPSISGTVTGPGGIPIADASVWANPYNGSGVYGSAATGPEGTYTIAGISAGSYRVQACAEGYVCEYWDDHEFGQDADPVAVTEGQDTPNINFSLRVGGTISGVVMDGATGPLEGCWVYANPYAGDGTYGSATAAADGTYSIGGLATGSYRVQAQCAGYVTQYWNGHDLSADADPVAVTEGSETPSIDFSLRVGGTISGVITDEGGNPISNGWANACPWDGGYCQSASTGPDGAYTAEGLATGYYRVQVSAPGHLAECYDDHLASPMLGCGPIADPVPVTEGSETPNIDFDLREEGTISGVVTDSQGNPLPSVQLSASPLGEPYTSGWALTAPDGSYTIHGLATGSYRVRAFAQGHVPEFWDDQVEEQDADPVPATEGSDTPNINFSLRIGGTISGTVTDEGDNPISQAGVSACSWEGFGYCQWILSGPDGSYTIGGLATGSYRVNACADGYACEYYDNHPIGQGEDPVEVTEPLDTPSINFSLSIEATISGVVTGPSGAPMPSASVTAYSWDGCCSWGVGANLDGTYTIGGLPAGSYRVDVYAEGYVREYWDDHLTWEDADPVVVTEGADTTNIDFILRVEGTISGIITDEGGNPIQGWCWVNASPFTGGGDAISGEVGPDGTYTIGRLATGSYRVDAQCEGYVRQYWDGHDLSEDANPVPVAEGQDTPNIDFSLRIGGTISGVVTDEGGNPLSWASLRTAPYSGTGSEGWGYTQADGTYTISGLATGTYRVDAYAPGYVRQYWDGHLLQGSADPIPVTEGIDTPNITFDLPVALGPCGDVDCGSAIDAVDALFILQDVVGLRTCSDQYPPSEGTLYCGAADVNGDTVVDAVDALFVLQCVVGLRTCSFQCSVP